VSVKCSDSPRARPVSLARCYRRPMIVLDTIAALHEHRHELHAYCPRCERWVTLDLAQMIREGRGSLREFRVRCRECGGAGRIQVQPPVPPWSNSNGWTEG